MPPAHFCSAHFHGRGPSVAPVRAIGASLARELDTMRVRDFSTRSRAGSAEPVVVAAPYAGHGATITDFAKDQS